MGNRKEYLKKEIARISQKLDQKGFGANHDGNITCRFEEYLLATPTAESKGDITSEMIIMCDMDGKKVEGVGNSFSEIKLHLAAYRSRDDVKAVVHAHPPYSTARGLAGLPLEDVPIPESIVSIGNIIPVAAFAMPGAPENDQIVANMLEVSDVFMMPGNGVLSVGDDLTQAYLRLELVEHLAKIVVLTNQIGKPFEMNDGDIKKLLDKRASIGLGPEGRVNRSEKVKVEGSSSELDDLKKIIKEEVKKVLTR
ncbi:MAG: class II aldolase/adducin family protein [Syntrophaceae bacterium]|nr:class II aldolase/adducin family protein [bacterium]MCG2740041.1 class II aldolase/adducin family protein [Syntrophaceae bacterium]